MEKPEKKTDAKPLPKAEVAKRQQFSLEELRAMGLDPVPYGYPAAK